MAFTYCTNCGEKIDDSVERCPHCNHPKGIDRVYGYTSEDFGKKGSADSQSPRGGAQNGGPWESGQNSNGGNANPWEGGQNQHGQSRGSQGGNPWENNGQNPYGQSGGRGGNPWENGGGSYGQNGEPWNGEQNRYGGGPWQSPREPYGNGQGYGGYQPWQPREKRKISVGLLVFSIINILLGTCCAGSIFGIIGLVFAITARDAATEAEEIRRKKISLAINVIAVVLTVAFMISFAIGFIQAGGISAFLPQ